MKKLSTTKTNIRKIFLPKNVFIIAAIVPAIIFFATFWYGAVTYALYMSLHKWAVKGGPFVGVANYVKVFTEDPLFYVALVNTFYFAAVYVFVGFFLALFIAFAVNHLGTIGKIFRTIYFVPYISSLAAISVMWIWLYQPKFGLVNQVITALGGPRLMWLRSPTLAMPAVIIMSIWHGIGYTMILFLAGLQGIPQVFYEAARIDGANKWHLFLYITVPLLKPTITFLLVVGMIYSLQVFTQMYVLFDSPGSGPLNSTRTIVVHLYERAFTYYQMGYASATAFVLFVVILIFSGIQLRLFRTRWEY